ncbi:MAG: NUDIX hydrolase [Streptosporangiaceae bacterium]
MTDDAESGPGRWRTFGEREIYRSPELWLGQVDVELPGGERIWEDVVRLHRTALMAVLDGQGRVLLVRRHRFVPDQWGWELPGGLVDAGEDSAEAALREVEDATGYRPGRVEELIEFRPLPEKVDCVHVAYVGHDPEHVGEAVSAIDVARMEWVPLESVPSLIATGEIWQAGTLVALLRLLTMDGSIPAR